MRSHYNDHPRPLRRAGKTGWIIFGVIATSRNTTSVTCIVLT